MVERLPRCIRDCLHRGMRLLITDASILLQTAALPRLLLPLPLPLPRRSATMMMSW